MAPGHFLYVHVPFCEQRCTYCDFYTVTSPGDAARRADEWLRLVVREMALWRAAGDLDPTLPVETVFLGGGTPSRASAEGVAHLLDAIRAEYQLSPVAEITLETQPGTVDRDKARALVAAGVNRLSVGVQTFQPALLAQTGRLHSVDDSRQLLEDLRSLRADRGITYSIDLISCWPGQTPALWREDLREAAAWGADHISVYELTYHGGTAMRRKLDIGAITPPGEEDRVQIFEETAAFLSAHGYEHYEISNFARPGRRSRHNENYWRLGNYVGLGAGAHSFVFPRRYLNENAAEAYRQSIAEGRLFRREIPRPDPHLAAVENFQMGLRLADGVDLDWFASRYGVDLRETRAAQFRALVEEAMLVLDGPVARLTHAGRLRFDSLIEYLL